MALGLHLCAELRHLKPEEFARALTEPGQPSENESALRFIIPVEQVESAEGIAALAKISRDDFIYAAGRRYLEPYLEALKKATNGIEWRFAAYPEGYVFQAPSEQPFALEAQILTKLQLQLDLYQLAPMDGMARISYTALKTAGLGYLMESIVLPPI